MVRFKIYHGRVAPDLAALAMRLKGERSLRDHIGDLDHSLIHRFPDHLERRFALIPLLNDDHAVTWQELTVDVIEPSIFASR